MIASKMDDGMASDLKNDRPKPTALRFGPKADLNKEGYRRYLKLIE